MGHYFLDKKYLMRKTHTIRILKFSEGIYDTCYFVPDVSTRRQGQEKGEESTHRSLIFPSSHPSIVEPTPPLVYF